MMGRRTTTLACMGIAALLTVLGGCEVGLDATDCTSDDACASGQVCAAGTCTDGSADGGGDVVDPDGGGDVVDPDATGDGGSTDTAESDTDPPDTGGPDTGESDSGGPDTGESDSGGPDTGEPDVGPPDTGGPTPTCGDYCDTVMAACTGDAQQYDTREACMAACEGYGWRPGTYEDAVGNTVGCRITHASYALEGDAAMHCTHAGYTGGGVCGQPCAVYCAMSAAICTGENAHFDRAGECVETCLDFVDEGEIGDTAGNTVFCRMYHLTAAAVGVGAARAHCPHADIPASSECVGCGDGVVHEGEVCDEGPDNSDSDPDACRTDCTAPRCGDGVVDTAEVCDPGDEAEPIGCGSACQIACPACRTDADCGPRTVCVEGTDGLGTACLPVCSGDAGADACPTRFTCVESPVADAPGYCRPLDLAVCNWAPQQDCGIFNDMDFDGDLPCTDTDCPQELVSFIDGLGGGLVSVDVDFTSRTPDLGTLLCAPGAVGAPDILLRWEPRTSRRVSVRAEPESRSGRVSVRLIAAETLTLCSDTSYCTPSSRATATGVTEITDVPVDAGQVYLIHLQLDSWASSTTETVELSLGL